VSRPSWDEYFLGIAVAVSARADCRRARHGAVIVGPDRRVVATGYNGSPPGGPSCLAGECPRGLKSYDERPGARQGNNDYSDCVAIHAEANALVHGAYAQAVGGTVYITGKPCDMCSKLIKAAGIERVVTP
jgi:dCMP deaminase